MKRRLFCVLAMLLVGGGIAFAGDEVAMQGQFVWTSAGGDSKGDLEAVFAPTGKNEWKVAFHFEWEGKARVFAGTAQGSLSEGSLEGTVDNGEEGENKRRYRFRGSFKDGTFSGTHAVLPAESDPRTLGTLTLRPAG